jgi:hypothetical protein
MAFNILAEEEAHLENGWGSIQHDTLEESVRAKL